MINDVSLFLARIFLHCRVDCLRIAGLGAGASSFKDALFAPRQQWAAFKVPLTNMLAN
jgi:hypothetical protein